MKTISKAQNYIGSVIAPASKSYMQRAIILALLAEGESLISNPSDCKDSKAMLAMAVELGAQVNHSKEGIRILGKKEFGKHQLIAGESGLGVRTILPVAALSKEEVYVTGKGSLLNRPMHMILDPLKEMGVTLTDNQGHLPVRLKGPLLGGKLKIDGRLSSQALSGFLMALPKASRDSIIEVNALQSIPYIDMTIGIMQEFGLKVTHDNYQEFRVKGNQKYQAQNYDVEGDWSAAAFHLVGGAIAGAVSVTALHKKSLQADMAILNALKAAGAKVYWSENKIHVSKEKLNAFAFDASHCPDLFPPLAVLAVACKGVSRIKGVHRLIHKESNRAAVLEKELKKMGIEILLENDEMQIRGAKPNGATIDSHNDHRIAMMAAMLSLMAVGPIHIIQAEAVDKSYPHFFESFEDLCLQSKEINESN